MQVCVANGKEEQEECRRTLTFKSLATLLSRHTKEEIQLFEKSHRKELLENCILVFVPEHLRKQYQNLGRGGGNFEFHTYSKTLYLLGSCFYFFLTKTERQEIKEILSTGGPLEKEFLLHFRDCFTVISTDERPKQKSKTQTKTKTKITIKKVVEKREVEVEEAVEEDEEARRELVLLEQMRDQALRKRGMLQEWVEMGTELAVQKRENILLREQLQNQQAKIELLCVTMNQFIQLHQQQLTMGTNTGTTTMAFPQKPLSLENGQSHRKIRTIEEWIGPNLYGLEEVGTDKRLNFGKWDGLFIRPEITPISLLQHAISASFHPFSQLIKLSVKLTYEYPLKMILHILEEVSYERTKEKFQQLMKLCPSNYKIVLFANVMMDDNNPYFNEITNRTNISNILLHCQLIMTVNRLNRDGKGEAPNGEYIIQTCKEQDALLKPDFTLMDNYFPSFLSHGPNTYLSYIMGLNVVKPNSQGTGDGIGSNKSCAFCRTRTRISKNVSGEIQRAHQPKKCPLLATIGNNEVTILLAIRDVLLKSDKKQSDALKNIHSFFGNDDESEMGDDELNLYNTLLRHATDEEFANGQHINGLRLNKAIYMKLRFYVIKLLKQQFQSKLFTERLDDFIRSLFSSVHVEGLDLSILTIGSLILDSNGDSFLSTKLSDLNKPAPRKSKNTKGKKGKLSPHGKKEEESNSLAGFTNANHLFFSFQDQYSAAYTNTSQNQYQFFNFEREQQQIFINNFIQPSLSYSMPDFSSINL